MQERYWLYQRTNGVFYLQDRVTMKQESLRTKEKAVAKRITSPDYFAKNLAFECLWDCEEGVRELGDKFAPLDSTEARYRIQHPAKDAQEEVAVRAVATERLKSAP